MVKLINFARMAFASGELDHDSVARLSCWLARFYPQHRNWLHPQQSQMEHQSQDTWSILAGEGQA